MLIIIKIMETFVLLEPDQMMLNKAKDAHTYKLTDKVVNVSYNTALFITILHISIVIVNNSLYTTICS